MKEGATQTSGERISLSDEESQIATQEFQQKGYCILSGSLSSQLLGLMHTYSSFYTRFHPSYFVKVNGSLIRYGDLLFESALSNIQHLTEQVSDRQLFPVFSLLQSLPDQASFGSINYGDKQGISAMLCVNVNNTNSLTFEIQGEREPRLQLNSGDILVYDTERIALKGKEASAGESTFSLFHYVDTSGKFTDWKFDKRSGVGALISRPEMEAKVKALKS